MVLSKEPWFWAWSNVGGCEEARKVVYHVNDIVSCVLKRVGECSNEHFAPALPRGYLLK